MSFSLRVRSVLLPGVLALSACASNRTGIPQVSAGEAAVAGVVLGVTSSAVSRAQGGCYAACPTGTTCDPESGYCVSLPCGGRCSGDEFCDKGNGSATSQERCVRVTQPVMQLSGEAEGPKKAPASDAPTAAGDAPLAQPAAP